MASLVSREDYEPRELTWPLPSSWTKSDWANSAR